MEPNFTERLKAQMTRRPAVKVRPEEMVLAAIGGEKLAGSGFEEETPDPEFSEPG